MGQNFIRTQLATIQGAAVPLPYGGKFRQVMVDLNPGPAPAKGLSRFRRFGRPGQSESDLPGGHGKNRRQGFSGRINSSPRDMDEMNIMPLKRGQRRTVYLKDVAQVRDGYSVQTSIVRTNGRRGALLTVLRNGKASTLAVVNNVKAALPKILAGLPSALQVRQLFDQSLFVRAAINGVVREGVIAAMLTGLMILLFLGSWRSTVIVCISIPLSILASLIVLNLLGRDHQRDDARRPGARRRHPGGRRDRRTEQRRTPETGTPERTVDDADALAVLAESAVAHGLGVRSGGDRYQVVVHVDPGALSGGDDASASRCELDDGAPLARHTAQRICCDASLVALVESGDDPLSVGRKTRAIPPAMQRALRTRDQGCRFPGCRAATLGRRPPHPSLGPRRRDQAHQSRPVVPPSPPAGPRGRLPDRAPSRHAAVLPT